MWKFQERGLQRIHDRQKAMVRTPYRQPGSQKVGLATDSRREMYCRFHVGLSESTTDGSSRIHPFGSTRNIAADLESFEFPTRWLGSGHGPNMLLLQTSRLRLAEGAVPGLGRLQQLR